MPGKGPRAMSPIIPPAHHGCATGPSYLASSTSFGRYFSGVALNLPWQVSQQKAMVLLLCVAVSSAFTGWPVRGHLVLTALAAAGTAAGFFSSGLASGFFSSGLG